MYCWKLRNTLDVEDDINDLHICIDRDLVDSSILKMLRVGHKIDFPIDKFPSRNPKHIDLGLEESNEAYSEEVVDFKLLQISIDDSSQEIIVSSEKDFTRISLSKNNLIKLTTAIEKSKTFAYVNDNYLQTVTLKEDLDRVSSKLLIWSGVNGDIVYC